MSFIILILLSFFYSLSNFVAVTISNFDPLVLTDLFGFHFNPILHLTVKKTHFFKGAWHLKDHEITIICSALPILLNFEAENTVLLH